MNNFLFEGLGELLLEPPDPFFYQAVAAPANLQVTRVLDIYSGFGSWLFSNMPFFSAYGSGVQWYAIHSCVELVKTLRQKRAGVLYFCNDYHAQRFQRGLFDFQYLGSGLLQVLNPADFFGLVCLNTAPGGRLLLRYPALEWLQDMEIAGSEAEVEKRAWWNPVKLSQILEEVGFAHVTFWERLCKPDNTRYEQAENYCRQMISLKVEKSAMALFAADYFSHQGNRPKEIEYIEVIAVKEGSSVV